MEKVAPSTAHPYVASQKNFCGGSPVIEGTRFPVRSVVNYVLQQGLTPEELVREFPNLHLAQVYDALSFYYDHQQEVEQDMEENSEEALQGRESRG